MLSVGNNLRAKLIDVFRRLQRLAAGGDSSIELTVDGRSVSWFQSKLRPE